MFIFNERQFDSVTDGDASGVVYASVCMCFMHMLLHCMPSIFFLLLFDFFFSESFPLASRVLENDDDEAVA